MGWPRFFALSHLCQICATEDVIFQMCNNILQQKIILRCRKQFCMLGALAQGLFGYVAWEWWEFRWSCKWNWYSSRLNTSILVWQTCTIALSGWVLYRQLELTKLTGQDWCAFVHTKRWLSVCLWHLFHNVPVFVSSWNFHGWLPLTEVMSTEKVKVRD